MRIHQLLIINLEDKNLLSPWKVSQTGRGRWTSWKSYAGQCPKSSKACKIDFGTNSTFLASSLSQFSFRPLTQPALMFYVKHNRIETDLLSQNKDIHHSPLETFSNCHATRENVNLLEFEQKKNCDLILALSWPSRVRSLEEIFKSLHLSSGGCKTMLVCLLAKVMVIIHIKVVCPRSWCL